MDIPLIRPRPPSYLLLQNEIAQIERAGIFSNYGPTNTRFESALEQQVFLGSGACLSVCNATIGLMMAIRAVVERAAAPPAGRPRYALMPSFTFAAAAHAAVWAGLTPLFCDIDPDDWSASEAAEEALIATHGSDIAVIVPYATFGTCIDTDRYERLMRRTGIPVVVDAAASLGSVDHLGDAFGARCPFPVVFSMHATKTFSTGEGGVIFSTDRDLIDSLRTMGNFGFGEPRSATMLGINSKLSEMAALLALTRLHGFDRIVTERQRLLEEYRARLPGWTFQEGHGLRQAHQFVPVLPPASHTGSRDDILDRLKERRITAAAYFSPHLAEQPFFKSHAVAGPLPVTDAVAGRIISLPLWDGMTDQIVSIVCDALRQITDLPGTPMVVPAHLAAPILPVLDTRVTAS